MARGTVLRWGWADGKGSGGPRGRRCIVRRRRWQHPRDPRWARKMVSMRPRHMVVKRTGTDGESLFSNGLILELCSDATLRNWGVGLDVDMKANRMQFGELCCDETLPSLGRDDAGRAGGAKKEGGEVLGKRKAMFAPACQRR